MKKVYVTLATSKKNLYEFDCQFSITLFVQISPIGRSEITSKDIRDRPRTRASKANKTLVLHTAVQKLEIYDTAGQNPEYTRWHQTKS